MVLDTVDFKDYSISVFIRLLIKLSHCKQNKNCSIFFWTDSLIKPVLRMQVRKLLPFMYLLVKLYALGYQLSDNSLSPNRTQIAKDKSDPDFLQ